MRSTWPVTWLVSEVVTPSGALATGDVGDVGDATTPFERHAAVMQAAVELECGAVVECDRHRVVASFPGAMAAARAAVECQRTLGTAEGPSDPPLRARMALRSGVSCDAMDVSSDATALRTKHLSAVAFGGQVLVSESTSQLLAGNADPLTLHDLGVHRLRDLGPSERIFQLVAPDLRTAFPAPRSLDHPDLPNNLPTMVSPFVGRASEIVRVLDLVADARLVTLTGPGGAGKTRLAVQAAAEWLDGATDGAWLVELAPVTDERRVTSAILAALDLPEADTDGLEVLVQSLERQRPLLVLDNCEHLVDRVVKIVDQLMRECPGVRVLATSREPLGLDGERVYRVPSLSLPGEDVIRLSETSGSDAVRLFLTRAEMLGASIAEDEGAVVASVCRRLDGMPLAIELAAARLTALSLQELADRLDERFRILTGGARNVMARQQTLQALVDWSYELLNPAERSVLQRLSVFSGSFSLDAVDAVCVGDAVEVGVAAGGILDVVHSLVQKSLVTAEPDAGATRYRLLETIRQYASAELLRDGGPDGVLHLRNLHATHFLGIARLAVRGLQGAEIGSWMATLDRDVDNLRAALSHLAESRPVEALELVASLERFFNLKAAADVVAPALKAVSRVDQQDPQVAEVVSEALIAISAIITWHLIGQRDSMEAVTRYVRRAEELAIRTRRVDLEARALTQRAHVSLYFGDQATAVACLDEAEAIARRCRNGPVLVEVLMHSLHLSLVGSRSRSTAQAAERAEEALQEAIRGDDLMMVSQAKFWQGTLALNEGRPSDSRRLFEECLAVTMRIGAFDGTVLNNYMIACLVLGDYDAAISPLRKCLRRMRRSGFRTNPGDLFAAGACIASWMNEYDAASQLHGAADAVREPAYSTGELFRTDADIAMEQASLERTQVALGHAAFAKAYGSGRELTLSQASDLALATLR